MAKYGQENDRQDDIDERLSDHASRASALLASRANDRKRAAGGQPTQTSRAAQPTPTSRAAQPTPTRRSARAAAEERPSVQRYPKSLGEFVRQNIVYIAGVAAVAIIVAIGLVALPLVMPKSESSQPTVSEPYRSPYNWENLDRSDGRFQYVVNGEVKSRLGVDVSDHQQDIDWDAVAADGIDFAMIRVGYRGATEGELYLDEQFYANLEGARSAGVDCGVYFFSQAQNEEEAVEEAEFVLDQLGGTALEYPIAFDSEVAAAGVDAPRTAELSSDEMTAIANAFCSRIEQAGYRSMVYGNSYDLMRYDYGMLEQRAIWWAEYTQAAPSHYMDIVMWQYANDGAVDGIYTDVDMNIDLSNALL